MSVKGGTRRRRRGGGASRTDDVRGPVAPPADGVEGEVGGALVHPPGDALAHRPRTAHDELAAGVRVREHADVVALDLAIFEDVDLNNRGKGACSIFD